MRAIEIHQYGAANDVLVLNSNAKRPEPGPDEILIEVHATAVNPVDCVARAGYGRHFFSSLGWGTLPLILGRDVSGIVAERGSRVSHFELGDEVYASPPIGCYAEFVVVKAEHAGRKPGNLTHIEAASLPFIGLTTWSALVEDAGLSMDGATGKKIVIPRAAGGVGSFAVQLMKAYGASVAGICSTKNMGLVARLGATTVIDYTKENFWELLADYDVAFDTIGRPSDFGDVHDHYDLDFSPVNGKEYDELLMDTLKKFGDATYVTICSPKVALTNQLGLEAGLNKAKQVYAERAAAQQMLGRRYLWSFFKPSGEALSEIAALVEANKIRPVVDRVYKLEDLPAAHRYCESQQARGKIIVDVLAA